MNRKSFLKLGIIGAILTPVIGFCKGKPLNRRTPAQYLDTNGGMLCNLSYIENALLIDKCETIMKLKEPILLSDIGGRKAELWEITSSSYWVGGNDEEIMIALIVGAARILSKKDGLSPEDEENKLQYLCEKFNVVSDKTNTIY